MSRVVVAGAGFAGLAAGAELARRGHAVTVLEAGAEVGGKARSVLAAGARVDLGPTLLTDLEPLRDLFERSGLDLARALPLEAVDPALLATFPRGEIAIGRDGARLRRSLAALSPHAERDWERLLDLGARAERLARHFCARGDVAGPRDLLRFALGGSPGWRDLVPFLRHRTLAGLLGAAVRTPELRRVLGHFARFLGTAADRAPAVALVIPYLLAERGVVHPRGGFGAAALAIAGLLRKHGGEIETGVRVDGLRLGPGGVTRVVTSPGGDRPVDAVVAAVDVAVTAGWLRPGPLARRVAGLAPGLSARVAWWVIEGAAPEGAHHALHFSADPGAEPVYVAMPTITDRELAPPGVSVLHALVHGPCGAPGTAAAALEIQAALEARSRWPAGRVLAHGVAGGAEPCYGGAMGPGLLGCFRPSQRVAGVGNLVLAGGSVFPGPGVANAIRSGVRAADLLHAALGARR